MKAFGVGAFSDILYTKAEYDQVHETTRKELVVPKNIKT